MFAKTAILGITVRINNSHRMTGGIKVGREKACRFHA